MKAQYLITWKARGSVAGAPVESVSQAVIAADTLEEVLQHPLYRELAKTGAKIAVSLILMREEPPPPTALTLTAADIDVGHGDGRVHLDIKHPGTGDPVLWLAMTPQSARTLAQALQHQAQLAEEEAR